MTYSKSTHTTTFLHRRIPKMQLWHRPHKTIQTELGMNASISKGLICRSDANRGSNTNQAHPLIDEQASRAPEPPRSSSHRIPTPSKHLPQSDARCKQSSDFRGNPIQLIRQLMRLVSVSGRSRTVRLSPFLVL